MAKANVKYAKYVDKLYNNIDIVTYKHSNNSKLPMNIKTMLDRKFPSNFNNIYGRTIGLEIILKNSIYYSYASNNSVKNKEFSDIRESCERSVIQIKKLQKTLNNETQQNNINKIINEIEEQQNIINKFNKKLQEITQKKTTNNSKFNSTDAQYIYTILLNNNFASNELFKEITKYCSIGKVIATAKINNFTSNTSSYFDDDYVVESKQNKSKTNVDDLVDNLVDNLVNNDHDYDQDFVSVKKSNEWEVVKNNKKQELKNITKDTTNNTNIKSSYVPPHLRGKTVKKSIVSNKPLIDTAGYESKTLHLGIWGQKNNVITDAPTPDLPKFVSKQIYNYNNNENNNFTPTLKNKNTYFDEDEKNYYNNVHANDYNTNSDDTDNSENNVNYISDDYSSVENYSHHSYKLNDDNNLNYDSDSDRSLDNMDMYAFNHNKLDKIKEARFERYEQFYENLYLQHDMQHNEQLL